MITSNDESVETVAGEIKSGITQVTQEKQEQQEKTSAESSEAELTKGPDWYIMYGMPSCYQPGDMEPIQNMGGIRIHWMRVSPEQVLGTQLVGDTNIIFTGTLDGRHLELTDKEFYKGTFIEPFKIFANFDEFVQSFQGVYTAKIKYKDQPIPGCPADGTISGEVSAKPM